MKTLFLLLLCILIGCGATEGRVADRKVSDNGSYFLKITHTHHLNAWIEVSKELFDNYKIGGYYP